VQRNVGVVEADADRMSLPILETLWRWQVERVLTIARRHRAILIMTPNSNLVCFTIRSNIL